MRIIGLDIHRTFAEVAILQDLEKADPQFKSRLTTILVRDPFEVRPDCRIVKVVTSATEAVRKHPPQLVGDHAWMDAALLSAAGIETVVIGPSGGGAHSSRNRPRSNTGDQRSDVT